ncbi:hypothetical protein B0H14DRAFT_2339709 [Mycena olivaceomarginata]|nr:hypothetical protein B0H14DRAFT_2339709 [Mycena olivaceomarginata]
MQAEEARVRERFYWADLKADQRCLRYGTRVYSARLANVPRQYDPVEACTETAIEINGQKILSPHQCEDRSSPYFYSFRVLAVVFGHWTVNYSEPTCVTYFTGFADKGCISPGSGRRRSESRLWNLQSGDDWRDMCSTTPADFLQMHFERPDICEHRGIYRVWGMWEFEDPQC